MRAPRSRGRPSSYLPLQIIQSPHPLLSPFLLDPAAAALSPQGNRIHLVSQRRLSQWEEHFSNRIRGRLRMPTDDAFDVGSVGNSAHRRLPRLSEASPKLPLRAEISEAGGCVCVLFAWSFDGCVLHFYLLFFPWASFVGLWCRLFFLGGGFPHHIIAEARNTKLICSMCKVSWD